MFSLFTADTIPPRVFFCGGNLGNAGASVEEDSSPLSPLLVVRLDADEGAQQHTRRLCTARAPAIDDAGTCATTIIIIS